MASSKEYLDFVLDQLSGLEGITWRRMMGEYMLYYEGRLFGGIYDDRFLVKPTASARRLLPEAVPEAPYPGAKELLPADVDDRELLMRLIPAMAAELPPGKQKKPSGGY